MCCVLCCVCSQCGLLRAWRKEGVHCAVLRVVLHAVLCYMLCCVVYCAFYGTVRCDALCVLHHATRSAIKQEASRQPESYLDCTTQTVIAHHVIMASESRQVQRALSVKGVIRLLICYAEEAEQRHDAGIPLKGRPLQHRVTLCICPTSQSITVIQGTAAVGTVGQGQGGRNYKTHQ